MPVARPTMAASANGELKTRSLPDLDCRPKVRLKTPPFHQLLTEIFFAAAVSDIFAEDDDAFVALHFVAERRVDEVRHGFGGELFGVFAFRWFRCGLRIES